MGIRDVSTFWGRPVNPEPRLLNHSFVGRSCAFFQHDQATFGRVFNGSQGPCLGFGVSGSGFRLNKNLGSGIYGPDPRFLFFGTAEAARSFHGQSGCADHLADTCAVPPT